ncbi:MAG: aldehyde dehydrogenase family protein [Solirubrobacterales bacterium]
MSAPGRACSYVDGEFVAATGTLAVENPATEEVVVEASAADLATFERAILAARRAFDAGEWSGRGPAARAVAVRALLDHLDSCREELVATMVAQTGCPISLTRSTQVGMALKLGRDLVELIAAAPEDEYAPTPIDELGRPPSLRVSTLRYEPAGVAALITPYNFPLLMDVVKVVPALMVGCTAVLRPSPLTPLTAPFFGEAADAAGIPSGVLNVVLENGSEGAALLTTHPAVDVVSFTGSTAVGRAVARQASGTLKQVQLELGGKSAQIHLPGASAGAAARAIEVFARHAGQFCGAQSRMFVHEDERAAVLEALARRAEEMVVGDPLDPAVQMGPVISGAQLDRCLGYVDAAVEAGATVVTGGAAIERFERGHYMAPTVLDCPSQDNPAVREEIFGPVVCVLGYHEVEEAIAMANDTDYGLSGAVYGPVEEAIAVARRIRSGTVGVNGTAYTAWTPHAGWKQSGLGIEGGLLGARQFQLVKHMPIASPR